MKEAFFGLRTSIYNIVSENTANGLDDIDKIIIMNFKNHEPLSSLLISKRKF